MKVLFTSDHGEEIQMSRYKRLIERSATDRKELRGILQNPLSDPDLTIRAQAILMLLDGSKGDEISRELRVRPNTVSAWRKRYEDGGVEGLYDKTPKGRRGSETRKQVLDKLQETPPEGGWSTQALADAVGTSRDTVRRALKDQHLTVSNTTIWDQEIQRSPRKACVDAIGLYLAKEEAGLIIQVDSMPTTESGSYSYVTTRNRGLAKSLTLMEQSETGLSLGNALQASVQHMKEVPRGEKETFQSFLNDILGYNMCTDSKNSQGHLFYIFYWHDEQKKISPVLQRTGVVVEMTDDVIRWMQMIEPWIGIMSQSLPEYADDKETELLISSINRYINHTTVYVEPFEWRKRPA